MSNLVLYLITVLVWGSTWFAIEFQLGIVAPEVSIVYRYVGASLLLFAWSVYKGLNLRFSLRDHGWFVLLGLFLFGMNMMSKSLQRSAGGRMRAILSALTINRFIGVAVGAFVTMVIQSSSATTVMLVSFVQAQLMTFGQTLGVWGVGSGPYLVLPLLGPSSVRDGSGLLVDAVVRNEIRNEIVELETWQEWTWTILDAIDTRAHVAFRYYETGSPFEYEWVRMLYSTKRKLDIEK